MAKVKIFILQYGKNQYIWGLIRAFSPDIREKLIAYQAELEVWKIVLDIRPGLLYT